MNEQRVNSFHDSVELFIYTNNKTHKMLPSIKSLVKYCYKVM